MKAQKGEELIKEKVDLIIVGNQNSGKTSLINKFIGGESTKNRIQNLSAIYILLHWVLVSRRKLSSWTIAKSQCVSGIQLGNKSFSL